MGIRHPLIHEIAADTWLINEFGLNNMYVLKGSERSLVIDAGMGYCDFAGIIESLVDHPYKVVITHAHPDHVGMMHQFDRIYINEKDWERLPYLGRKEFDLNEFEWNNRQHIGNWEVWEVTEDMINRGDKNTEVLPLSEGDVFDLGNRRVATFELPGHSAGHVYFIDDYSRIAFTGDCVNADNGSKYAVSTHIRNVQRLLNAHGKTYDRIFTGHSTYCGDLDVKSHPLQILHNIIEAYRSLLRGDAEIEMRGHHLHPEHPKHPVVVYGEGETKVTLAFNENLFWEEGEEHIIP